jgi:hypothetical protein
MGPDVKRRETRKRIKSAFLGTQNYISVFRNQHGRRRVRRDLEAHMSKKSPDNQQNQEELWLLSGRDMPHPAPVDEAAFARRAGEIIARASKSLHKPKGPGSKKRARRSG